MAEIVARVGKVTGEVIVRDADGNVRRLKEGDAVRAGEVIQAASGGQVQLLLADGREVVVKSGEAARIDAEVAGSNFPDAGDSAVHNSPQTFTRVARTLVAADGTFSFDDDAGRARTSGDQSEGHSFIELVRIVESVDPLAFQFATTRFPVNDIFDGGPAALYDAINAVTAASLASRPASAVTLNEQNVNDNAPVFGAGSYTFGYDENQVAGAVLGTVSATDADGGSVSYSITGGDPNGWYQINSAGQISLTAAGVASLANDFEALANTRALTVTASDGTNSTNVTVTLNETDVSETVNTPPTANAVSASGNEDATITVTLSATDSDGTITSYTVTALPANGKLYRDSGLTEEITLTGPVVAGATLYFRPNANWSGATSFTYTATDNQGASSASVTVSLTVNAVVDLTATNDSATTPEDVAYTGSVATNDSTTSGGTLTFAKASNPVNGSVTVNSDGTYTYTPNSNWSGTDSFTYTVTDSASGESTTRTVTVTVTPVADPLSNPGAIAVVVGPSFNFSWPDSSVGQPGYTDPNSGISVTATSPAVLGGNGGLGYGIDSPGGTGEEANRIDPSESLVFGFPTANNVRSITLNVKNTKDDTVEFTGTVDHASINQSSISMAGSLIFPTPISSTYTDVRIVVQGSGGTVTSGTATINSNGTWSISGFDASGAGTITSVKVVASVNGDVFSNGGDLVTFSVNRTLTSMKVAEGTLYGSKDGYQIDFISFAPTTTTSGFTYPVDINAVLQDTDTSEGFVTVQLSGFAAGSTLSYLNATTGQLTTIAASGAAQDGTAVFNIDQSLLTNAFNGSSFADQIYVTSPTALTSGFAPNLMVVTQDGAGSTANSFLGGSGNNNYTGTAGNDFISGGDGSDTLSGGAGSDVVTGGAGADTLAGGSSSDTLTGGAGADTFVWSFADCGTLAAPARDVITDFNMASYASGGDRLDLRDILQGTGATTATVLDGFLDFSRQGSDTVINVRATGAAGDVTQQIVLQGVDLTSNGTLNDQQIIQDLLTRGKLQTD